MDNEKKERALTVHEQQSIEAMKAKKSRGRDLFKTVGKTEDGNIGIEPDFKEDLSKGDAFREFQAKVHDATGCVDLDLAIKNLSKASNAITSDPNNTKVAVENMNRMARAMAALEPRDDIEGQLIAQLVVLHEQSMYWMGRAIRTDRVDFANTYLNASTKLVNRHHETLKTLMRYRQGGDQKIIVENVNVNQGGQAIVGHVTGGGSQPKNKDVPHAKM